MRKCYPTAILALLFLCVAKISCAQNGYLRFVDNLEDILIAAHNGNILPANSIVETDLRKLNIRRLVHPEHEVFYLQIGYDLNKDKVLNELDGFESVEGEKFSPWNDYIETLPCGEKESIYLEIRALQKDSTPIYLQKMLTLTDKTAPSVSCKPSIKIYLNAQDSSLKVYAQDLLAGKAYDDCRFPIGPRDTTISPEAKKFSIMYGGIDIFNPEPKPDSNQTFISLDCSHSGETIPLRLFAWDAAGNHGVCVSRVEVIDTSGLNCTQVRPFRFHDSLELLLRHHFALGAPLVPAAKLLLVKDDLHLGKIRIRRSIRKANLETWFDLGYDHNQDGSLDEKDGYDLNQDGDKIDEGEYFVEKGNFIWTPFLDSLPLFCTDFGDSLWLESQSILDASFGVNRCFKLERPNFFVNYRVGITKILKSTPDSNPYGELKFEGLHAQEFLKSPFYTCLTENSKPDFWGREQLSFSINAFGEKADSSVRVLPLECCHINKVALLNIHAWSKQTPQSLGSVFAYAEVFDERYYCPSDFSCSSFRIQGKIMDHSGLSITGVTVKIDGADKALGNLNVSKDGTFSYNNFPWGVHLSNYYLVTPSKNVDPLNGVSTFDLIQIQKHILNLKTFDSPFQYIAADVNRSGTISTLDVIQLRKLILGIDANFSNNTSWRFVNAKHIFQYPSEPFKAYLPEKIRVGRLNSPQQLEFIAIKIGDINGSAILK